MHHHSRQVSLLRAASYLQWQTLPCQVVCELWAHHWPVKHILHEKEWEPIELASPHATMIPLPILLPSTIKFGKALPLDVMIPDDAMGWVDDYVDDIITVILHKGDNWNRGSGAALLAIHTICHPVDSDEPLPCDNVLCLSKLKEKGTVSEECIVLGWRINMQSFNIGLPVDKFKAWSHDTIAVNIQSRWVTFNELNTLVGKRNHAGNIIPLSHYFLNSIRRFKDKAEGKTYKLWLSHGALEDLALWQDFLKQAHKGISLNLVTF